MRAIQIVQQDKPLQLREVAVPEPGPGEIRVKIEAAGICRSDAHYRAGTASVAQLPITPGHAIADRLPLNANEINRRLDVLAGFHGYTHSVITP